MHFKKNLLFNIVTLLLFFFINSKVYAINSSTSIDQLPLNDNIFLKSIQTKLKGSKYIIEVITNKNKFILDPCKPLNTFGDNNSISKPNIFFFDISRDTNPEIFVQSFDITTPIQHIYTYYQDTYKHIFSSTNNVIGILDSNNSRTPKVLSFSIDEPNKSLQKHMLINGVYKNISFSNDEIPGLLCISSLIDSLCYQKTYEDIFTLENADNEITKLDDIFNNQLSYSFLDATFLDTSWNSNNSVESVKWTLRFKPTNSNSIINLNVITQKLSNKFLIKKIDIE
ncbi:MAG: hypothetical protein ACRC41_16615 [Sarcina sp.]